MAKIEPIVIKPASTISELLTHNLFIWIHNDDEIDQVIELAELYDISIYPDSNALLKRKEDRDRTYGLLEFSTHLLLINAEATKANNIIKHEYSMNPNIITSLDQLKTALHDLKHNVNNNNTELTLSEINYLKQLTLIKVKGIRDLFYLVELCNKYNQDIAGNKYRITPELPAMFHIGSDCLDKDLGYLIHIEGLYIKISFKNVVSVIQDCDYTRMFKKDVLADDNFIIDNFELLEHLFKKEEEYKKKNINITGKFKV